MTRQPGYLEYDPVLGDLRYIRRGDREILRRTPTRRGRREPFRQDILRRLIEAAPAPETLALGGEGALTISLQPCGIAWITPYLAPLREGQSLHGLVLKACIISL